MSVTPDFIGQRYKDTNTGNIWIANSTTPGDWTLEVQNFEIEWEPKAVKAGEILNFFSNYDAAAGAPGITDLTLKQVTLYDTIQLENSVDIVSISLPNLVAASQRLQFAYNTVLVSFSAPLLQTVGKNLDVSSCPSLSSVNLPSLISADMGITLNDCNLTSVNLPNLVHCATGSNGISVGGNVGLTTLNIPVYVPVDGENFTGNDCAFSTAMVDSILARFVANAAYISGTIRLNGGTNGAPTTGAGSPHDILVARGVTIIHN